MKVDATLRQTVESIVAVYHTAISAAFDLLERRLKSVRNGSSHYVTTATGASFIADISNGAVQEVTCTQSSCQLVIPTTPWTNSGTVTLLITGASGGTSIGLMSGLTATPGSTFPTVVGSNTVYQVTLMKTVNSGTLASIQQVK